MQPKVSPKIKATRAVKRVYYDLRHAINDSGLSAGHADYTRFIILASARTGSTLMTRTLSRHGGVVTYGEIMRDQSLFPDRFPEFGNSRGRFTQEPARFLEERVYGKYPEEIGAVGFKIFYRHAPRDTGWGRAVWGYLAGQKGLRVIHLRRRNLLAVQVSRKTAAAAGEWIKYSGASQPADASLDYEETRVAFQQTRDYEREYEAMFADHPLLNVFYEDVSADYAAEMGRVQDFLGLPRRDIAPATKKRPSRPLSEQIANYDDLKARFAGTPWAEFFEESGQQGEHAS